MLWSNVILTTSSDLYGYKWEIVGFRAAWVSITQIPLLYCLGGKANIISVLTGISYERLNWLHRWIARTIFLTVIVHWSYFFREWWLADFVKDEFQMMPMIKYGFGAWGVLGWSVITGFGFFRAKCYELWVLQHLATAGVLLWLLFVHVPSYARYNIWMSVGFVAFDRGVRGTWSLYRNLHFTSLVRKVTGNRSILGFHSKVESHGDGYMSLSIKNSDFAWQPGQHVFISMPICGVFESHPFTISNVSDKDSGILELYFKCHSGFTGRLRKKAESSKADDLLTFVSGPWGNPPVSQIERCNTLIFVASSTGASFTVPLLEHAMNQARFVQRVLFHWIVRHDSQLKVFMRRITAALEAAKRLNIEAECRIFITRSADPSVSSMSSINEKDSRSSTNSSNSLFSEAVHEKGRLRSRAESPSNAHKNIRIMASSTSTLSGNTSDGSDNILEQHADSDMQANIIFSHGRPHSWDNLLHPTIAEAEGETVIVACGGGALIADIRNYVAWISDQRAVHKGTGAQGISLFTEKYGW